MDNVSDKPPTTGDTMAELVKEPWVRARLGISRGLVYQLVEEGKLPHVRLGRSIRFDPDAIEALIAAGGTR